MPKRFEFENVNYALLIFDVTLVKASNKISTITNFNTALRECVFLSDYLNGPKKEHENS